jgi:hypothetical protein
VKKILSNTRFALAALAMFGFQAAAAQPQATPETGTTKSATNTHRARHRHKRVRNSHHVKRHRSPKQHTQTQ